MELLRGGDLFDRIVERGRYNEQSARKIMWKITRHAVHILVAPGIVEIADDGLRLVHYTSLSCPARVWPTKREGVSSGATTALAVWLQHKVNEHIGPGRNRDILRF